MEEGWDKKATQKLVAQGLSWNHARIAVGLMAEERMNADRIGFERGFNNGCFETRKKLQAEENS